MSSKLTVCGVCEYRNINSSSMVWCSECDEGLCVECKEHHAASKGSREHSIVSMANYRKLPSNILEITQSCPKHNDTYVIFCKKHDCSCCKRCVVESHDKCGELKTIDDVIQNVKSSNAFLEMEHMLAEVLENLQRIRTGRQDNIQSLKENRIKIEIEIEQARVLINRQLDNLQESLMKELYAAEEKENKKINCFISSIQEKEREITEYQTNFDKIKQHASDLQKFVAMKYIQQDVTNMEQFLESLLEEDNMNHVTLSLENETTVENLHTALNNMGTIILSTRSSDTSVTIRKNKQAQIIVSITHVPTINDLKLTLKQTVNTNGEDISGCSLLPDGKMIFSCYLNHKIYIIKTDGSLDFTLHTRSKTFYTQFIEESEKLIVTSGMDESITMIDMKNRKTERSIKVGSWIYVIVHKDGKLFYNGCSSGLCLVNFNENSVSRLVNVCLSSNSGIAIWSNNLYYINRDSNSIICCDLQGTFKWKSDLKAYIGDLRDITIDNHGHVYVVGCMSNNVVVISPDGKKHRVLLSEKDGIKLPQTLFFDRTNNKLLISNRNNEAFLYDVSNC